jgi:cell wall-associated NlpC family hydrolase
VSHPTRSGRHRAANRYSAASELSSIMKSAGTTGVRASAVLAASGGLVATFALPAQASSASASTSPSATASAAADAALAARAETAASRTSTRAALVTPAVTAPEAAAPAQTDTLGVSGVKAVAKPKPKPKPQPVEPVATVTSTDTTSSASTTTSAPPPPAANIPQTSSAIVGIAEKYIGVPYVYGGSSPSGFDCSGLTQYVYGQAGISIPRTASGQQSAATPVSSPQPGDLVFFGYPAWHVGIYVGNGMMIDSPKPGTSVQYRSIFSGVSGYGRF